MLCKGLPLVAAFGFVIISTPDAKADLCFRYQNTSSGTLVARGAKLPAENTCEPLAMFEDGGFLGAATGTICVSATGFTVIFQYTYDGCVADYFESGICRLQIQNGTLPTVSSTCRGTLAGGTFFHEFNDGIIEVCSGIQVPSGGGGQCRPFKHHTVEPSTTPNDEPSMVPKK
jgi:hypothetical protein